MVNLYTIKFSKQVEKDKLKLKNLIKINRFDIILDFFVFKEGF